MPGRDGDRQSGLGFSAGREPEELDAEAAGRGGGGEGRGSSGRAPLRDRQLHGGLRPRGRGRAALVRRSGPERRRRAEGALAVRRQAGRGGRLRPGDARGRRSGARGMATNPFDGEGVPRQRTAAARRRGPARRIYTTATRPARRAKAPLPPATPSAARIGRVPRVAASNLVLRPGAGTLGRPGGAGGRRAATWRAWPACTPASTSSAARSRWASPGRLIENGALARPVREVTIATDFLSLARLGERPRRRCPVDPALRQRVHAVGGGGADNGIGDL